MKKRIKRESNENQNSIIEISRNKVTRITSSYIFMNDDSP